jgi:hypothetical protein
LTPTVTLSGSLWGGEECVSTTTGNIVAFVGVGWPGVLTLVDGGSTTTWQGALSRILDLTLVPGVGVVMADYDQNRVVLLSSVSILTHPANITVAVGSLATFSVALTATSPSAVTYSWTKGGVPVGTNSSTYSYTPTAADGGSSQIVCTVTHAIGRAVSYIAYLTVQVGRAWSSDSSLLPHWSPTHHRFGASCVLFLQCPAGMYPSAGAGCVSCPAYTTASSVGATYCLPTCPTLSELTMTWVLRAVAS